jgi:hypothetical protein
VSYAVHNELVNNGRESEAGSTAAEWDNEELAAETCRARPETSPAAKDQPEQDCEVYYHDKKDMKRMCWTPAEKVQ